MDASLNSKLRRLPVGYWKSPTQGAQEILEEDRSGVAQYQPRCLRGGGQQARCWAALSLHPHSDMGGGEHVR